MGLGFEPVLLSDIFSTKLMLVGRLPNVSYGILPEGQGILDAMSGGALIGVGEMPFVCHRNARNPLILEIMQLCDLPMPQNLQTYRTEAEFFQILQGHTQLVMQYPYPEEQLSDSKYWVKPKTLRFLNNKAFLDILFPANMVLPYQYIAASEPIPKKLELPCVVKVASDTPTAGGYSVVMCATRADVVAAQQRFSGHALLLEKKLVAQSISLQFAMPQEGEPIFLGVTEQIVSPEGRFQGNWLAVDVPCPPAVVAACAEVMRQAQKLGYFGFAGFDVLLENDHGFVVDANFRLTAATYPVLLRASLEREWQAKVLLNKSWAFTGSRADLRAILLELLQAKKLLPTAIFDPYDDALPFRVSSLLIGQTRAEVAATADLMRQQGFN